VYTSVIQPDLLYDTSSTKTDFSNKIKLFPGTVLSLALFAALVPLALSKTEICPNRAAHQLDAIKGSERCLPIETVQSKLDDLTLYVTGTEVELSLHHATGISFH
jgi:hypothetical protein